MPLPLPLIEGHIEDHQDIDPEEFGKVAYQLLPPIAGESIWIKFKDSLSEAQYI